MKGGRLLLLSFVVALSVCGCSKVDKEAVRQEAISNLRRLADSAVSYYQADHATVTGQVLPHQFPHAVGPTPSEIPCDGDKHEASWDDPTWEALFFAISDPHYLSYSFEPGGTPENPTFTASAYIRLDCDGDPLVFTWTAGPNDSLGLMPGEPGFDELVHIPDEFAE